jgi:hypothetical protein
MLPSRLYKFLPEEYIQSFLQGELLFRNLTSFKQMEDRSRGDVREGCHLDNPNNDVTIENVTTGHKISGRFSMRTSINTDKVYVFCTTTELDDRHFAEFGVSACIEITEPAEFIRRCRRRLGQLMQIDAAGLLCGNVEYYSPDRAPIRDIQDPKNIPFLKHSVFENQCEFRIAYAKKNVFKKAVKRLIINQDWDTVPDHLQGHVDAKILRIGPIDDITKVTTLTAAGAE